MSGPFHPVVDSWFREEFAQPTAAQTESWPAISAGRNTLLLAPTGSGKTLAAFLVAIDRIMFGDTAAGSGVRVLYISPLKALGVDVERNLKAPIAGVQAVAERDGVDYVLPRVAVRSGDTTSKERRNIARQPPDILITTPESLYLMLTSRVREVLRTVDTVIVDEIHSVVSSKRGAHLFLSLERLERLRRDGSKTQPLQRIGLSATQRPLDEIARLLGGAEATNDPDTSPVPRPVEIVEAGRRKELDLTIEVPVEDMAKPGEAPTASAGKKSHMAIPSIWPAIHPRLVALIRSHRSTMIFVNSRRLAERLAGAINELAEEEIALAHHGSVAKDTRQHIEERLKHGTLPAIVATSSLELGIDMGAVDLVIQIEAPPSVASGLQRIGRAGHQVGVPSKGIVFPKFRGDLLASAAASERMRDGEVEETFYARNPLDVLAQQIVAITAEGPIPVDEIFTIVRSAAPFAELPKSSFEGVLDLISGRYPSNEFAELRPRVNWDRIEGTLAPRRGTQRTAILNAGTIPDRGLYGVFLIGEGGEPGSRVGELDEEMVFETKPGEVFLLGASSWRVVEITHDRVLVVPAPGEPGRMPFWKGDGPGRPMDFGRAIGSLARRLADMNEVDATKKLTDEHGLDERASRNLLKYLSDQLKAAGETPSDQTIVVECFPDEVGDWRVAILSPFGSRVHAPWATAVRGRLQDEISGELDVAWTDDGIVFRLPEADGPPANDVFFPSPSEIEDLVVRELGSTALFAARFRENAARALLLPRRLPGQRTPLWLQRRRSADLLKVASRFSDFPIMLETYRECLRDVFDLPGLKSLLADVEQRRIRICNVQTESPSPFAASLMFSYTGNFLYDGDAPPAERRAAALALDYAQLRELLGDAELRELLDSEVVDQLSTELQRLDNRFPPKDADGLHDLLRMLGDLTREELAARCSDQSPEQCLRELGATHRIVELNVAGEDRVVAAEDAAKYRDVLGVTLPEALPEAFLNPIDDPLTELISRYARTHVPFSVEDAAQRLGVEASPVSQALQRLAERDRVVEGEFLPGGNGREWCDRDVLRTLKRRSLAKLREQIEPVDPQTLTRFLVDWQGIVRRRRGPDGILDAIEQLQGLPLPASILERDLLSSRVAGYRPRDLDELFAAGELVWQGCGSLGANDGRVALFLTDSFDELGFPVRDDEDRKNAEAAVAPNEIEPQIRELLVERGALFFESIQRMIGGFQNDLFETLWSMVWAGEVTNDTLRPLRSMIYGSKSDRRSRKRRDDSRFRSRRIAQMPGSEGRWSLLPNVRTNDRTATERQTALALQLIERYGILTRESVGREGPPGGFAGLYPVLKALEESGRIRRGYFVAGLGAAQFAAPGADERLRDCRKRSEESKPIVLSAVDPANPYGALLDWPTFADGAPKSQRAAGARVVLLDGTAIGWLNVTGESLVTFLANDEPAGSSQVTDLAGAIASVARQRFPVLLRQIDGIDSAESRLRAEFESAGFVASGRTLLHRGVAGVANQGPR